MHLAMSCMGCIANSFSTVDLQPPFAVDGVLGLHGSLWFINGYNTKTKNKLPTV